MSDLRIIKKIACALFKNTSYMSVLDECLMGGCYILEVLIMSAHIYRISQSAKQLFLSCVHLLKVWL